MTQRTRTAGGYEFHAVPAIDSTADDPVAAGQVVWVEKRPHDDHLTFPDEDSYDSGHPFGEFAEFATTGIAKHAIMKSGLLNLNKIELGFPESETGYSARQLNLFGDDDWFGECWQVLHAHGWIEGTQLASQEIVERVASVLGSDFVEEAQKTYGTEWRCFILEVAAAYFVPPLTRLWYAANLMSLYCIHQDDAAFGYLWSEYNVRLRQEANAMRGLKTRKSASKGGQARTSAQLAKRRRVLAEIERLVGSGHSVSRASELAHANGHGASPAANRKLWARHRKL